MSLSKASTFSSPFDSSGESSIREAEDRLREAVEELERRQRRTRHTHPPCDHADDSCVANAIGNLCQSFLLSYGVRVGIGILLRAFKLARGQSYASLLDLKQLVSEKDLIVREEACRIGLLFGGFTGSYHGLRCILRKWRKKETPFNVVLAGSVAGLSILALDDSSRRRTLALYLLARLAQCAYNSAKSKDMFHLWGSHLRHGDSLLFSLACAQMKSLPFNGSEKHKYSFQRIEDGITWLLNSLNETLGFILADNGYDVWIANTRGTNYSRGHTSLAPDPAYWDWSWDELVAYDLPATFKYVHDQTGHKLHYVGHSLSYCLFGSNVFVSCEKCY